MPYLFVFAFCKIKNVGKKPNSLEETLLSAEIVANLQKYSILKDDFGNITR
jgi:hypothetical protein